jgi:basic amino acid/polyamine antiporter, APA family
MVFVKVGIVLFFIIYGAGFVNPANWVPFAPNGITGIMGGAAIVFFSFIGFDAVSATAEETKNPQRDMPIGMMGSLIICTLLYAGVSLVLTGMMPYTKFANDAAPVATALLTATNAANANITSGAAAAAAASSAWWAHAIVAAGAIAGMTSVLLVSQLAQPRIFMAMSRDGLLPKLFSKLHPHYRTPWIPTILTGIAVGGTALFVDIGKAAELCSIGTLAAFILVCGGVMVLRKTHPEFNRPFRCPGSPLLPTLGIISCLVLMMSLPVITWMRFVLWMALGMLIYFTYGIRHHNQPPTPTLTEVP